MINPTISPSPEPRFGNARLVAAKFGRRYSWFYANRARLEQLGFPKRDNAIGLWDLKAIEAWLDKRAGIDSTSGIEFQMLEAIHGDNNARLSQ